LFSSSSSSIRHSSPVSFVRVTDGFAAWPAGVPGSRLNTAASLGGGVSFTDPGGVTDSLDGGVAGAAAAGAVPAGTGLPLPVVEHPQNAMKQTVNSGQNHRKIMRANSLQTVSEQSGARTNTIPRAPLVRPIKQSRLALSSLPARRGNPAFIGWKADRVDFGFRCPFI
jgi:hypothetical protein